MSDWSRTNFADLEDRSPADEPMRWAFARKALGSDELGVSRFTFEPGSRMPFGHRHKEQEEVYVIARGSGELKMPDVAIEVGVGDMIRVAADVKRKFIPSEDGLEFIAIGAPIGKAYEAPQRG